MQQRTSIVYSILYGHHLQQSMDQPGKIVNLPRGQLCLRYVLNSNMQRSWPRYIYVTSQGTGLILPCLALFTPRVFSWVRLIVFQAFVLVSIRVRCLCTEGTQLYKNNISLR